MKSTSIRFSVLAMLLMSGITLLLCELLIRFSGKYQSYSEIIHGEYSSYYNQTLNSHHLLHRPGTTFVLDHGEFQYPYAINGIGLREREIPEHRADSVKRLFVLGDSFTEGVGAPEDSTFVRFLASGLKGMEVYNCGVTGSDPVYEWKLLQDILIHYHPTHVLMMINHSDLEDLMLRGGAERFHADGTTHYRKGPSWEWIYQYSHVFRWMVHEFGGYNRLLQHPEQQKIMKQRAKQQLKQNVAKCSEWCTQKGLKFLLVVQPDPGEICNRMNRILELGAWFKNEAYAVVWPYHTMQSLAGRTDCFSMGWPEDGHYNAKGYAILASAVKNEIYAHEPFFFDEQKGNPSVPTAKSH